MYVRITIMIGLMLCPVARAVAQSPLRLEYDDLKLQTRYTISGGHSADHEGKAQSAEVWSKLRSVFRAGSEMEGVSVADVSAYALDKGDATGFGYSSALDLLGETREVHDFEAEGTGSISIPMSEKVTVSPGPTRIGTGTYVLGPTSLHLTFSALEPEASLRASYSVATPDPEASLDAQLLLAHGQITVDGWADDYDPKPGMLGNRASKFDVRCPDEIRLREVKSYPNIKASSARSRGSIPWEHGTIRMKLIVNMDEYYYYEIETSGSWGLEPFVPVETYSRTFADRNWDAASGTVIL